MRRLVPGALLAVALLVGTPIPMPPDGEAAVARAADRKAESGRGGQSRVTPSATATARATATATRSPEPSPTVAATATLTAEPGVEATETPAGQTRRAGRKPAAEPTATPEPTLMEQPPGEDGPAGAPVAGDEVLAEDEAVGAVLEDQAVGAALEEAAPTEPEPPTATPTITPRPVTRPAIFGRNEQGLALHVVRYVPLILGVAEQIGADPAVLAALMEVEGSGEDAVSPAGALGLMQLMPDKLVGGDDPFDPVTNVLRAGELILRLERVWNGDLAAIAGAYFGAVNSAGQITEASDGNLNGIQYVSRFAEAYERWAVAFGLRARTVAIRPVEGPRATATATATPEAALSEPVVGEDGGRSGPERDRWYLYPSGMYPVIRPVFY